MNYRLVANQLGDLLKYETTVNEINRAAQSVFHFSQERFPNDSITSIRAKCIHDWVLSLAKQSMSAVERNNLLVQFISIITPEEYEKQVDKILKTAQIDAKVGTVVSEGFLARNFHEVIHKHCRKLFIEENYFHAVFEAAKAYNKLVQQKTNSKKDGQALMLEVLSVNGVLKLNKGVTQTEKNVQEGVKFLSAGLMQAMRNPTAHEPALDWPISKDDCLDMLSFISYLLRQLDTAVHFDVSGDNNE
jgi:uncharacterized protein (TIGR02391 family)